MKELGIPDPQCDQQEYQSQNYTLFPIDRQIHDQYPSYPAISKSENVIKILVAMNIIRVT